MDKTLLSLLVCPLCKGKLVLKQQELWCLFDRVAYPIRDDIHVMLTQEARQISLEEKDQI